MFHDADSALKWAAKIKCTLIIDGSSVNDMCGKPRQSTTNELLMGLSPQEAQQQADMIIRYASSIHDPICAQYLQAKYFFMNKIDDIVHQVLAGLLHAIGGTNRRDIRLVVQSYLGSRVTRRQMRQSLRCRASDVVRVERDVYRVMDGVHYRAINEIESKFADAGLVRYG